MKGSGRGGRYPAHHLRMWDFYSEEVLEYPVEAKLVKKGTNQFEFLTLAADKKDLKIRDLRLWISYK